MPLYIVYTPSAGAGWPLEIRGNQPLQHKHSLKMAFFGRAFPDGDVKPSGPHDVDMSVTYMPQHTGQLPFDQLATAFEYFLSDQFEKLILPCGAALEYAVERTVIESLKKLNLPERGASKRCAIEVLIPLICKLHNVPLIDQRILNVLNGLWTRRNEMAHEGKLKHAIDMSEAAKLLAASMFYMNYLIFLRERLGLEIS